jgi:plastocyanin
MTRFALVIAALAASSSVAAAQAPAVPATLSEWKIALKSDTVQAGKVTFRVNNTGSVNHALYIRGEGVDQGTREIPVRQSANLTVTLKPGTYEVFCPLADESHKMAGMTRKLIVTPGAAAPAPTPKKPDA